MSWRSAHPLRTGPCAARGLDRIAGVFEQVLPCHPGLDPGSRLAPDADPGEDRQKRCLWLWTPEQVRGDIGVAGTARLLPSRSLQWEQGRQRSRRTRIPSRLAAAGLALALAGGSAGCGFEPLYATDGSARDRLARVQIDRIADRAGQQLRNQLLLSFPPGDPAAPSAWRLRVTLKEDKRELGVRKQDVATRANLTLTARYVLEDAVSDKKVLSGELRSVNSYNILRSPYGTLAAERNARARAVRQLADGLTARLAAWLGRPRTGIRGRRG